MIRAPAPFPLERLADIPERAEGFRLLERIRFVDGHEFHQL
ncbi:hypothetical protein ACH4P5_000949 [Vibrio mimicus]